METTHSAQSTGIQATSDGGFEPALPITALGRASLWLSVAFVGGFFLNALVVGLVRSSFNEDVMTFGGALLPLGSILLFACGIAAGVVGLVAIFRSRERSIVALIALVPMALAVILLVAGFTA